MIYLIVTIKSWNLANFRKLRSLDKKNKWVIISDPKKLTFDWLKKLKPRYVFFPHWSWIIPKDIWSNFECVVFHMTDLPYGRGGSPLQNLIVRGHSKTKISALRVEEGLDTGDVYMKADLKLAGVAQEIYSRASEIIFTKMIPEIIRKEPKPIKQKGEVVVFSRRRPEEGSIQNLPNLKTVYDFIRMLDAEGYPKAYLEMDNGQRLEFSEAKLTKGKITAKVEIYDKSKK